jgi:branched-chain amino acid transport system permease protein
MEMSAVRAAKPNVESTYGVRTLQHELPLLVGVIALLGALIWLLSGNSFALSVLSITLLYAGLATAWNIIGGLGGQFSIAHSVFFALGAYIAGNLYMRWNVSPWIAIMPAAVIAAGVGSLVSWPVFRLRGPFFAIATMAMTEVALAIAMYAEPLTGGARGLTVPWRSGLQNMIFLNKWANALLFLAYLALALGVMIVIARSKLGYYLQAVRDNQDAALASGINVLKVKLTGMAISAALTSIGGIAFMMYVRVVEPHGVLSLFDVGVKIALIALIGGLGTIYGPLLGAMLIIPLDYWLRAVIGSAVPGGGQIVLGVLLIVSALFMKRGIDGALRSGRTRLWGMSK